MIRMYAGQFDERGKALAGHGDKKTGKPVETAQS
jgi:hypothetical protein